MKKTFNQLSEDIMNNRKISDSDCRSILFWYNGSSIYFPTEAEKEQAINAFIWLYKNISSHDEIHFNSAARNSCILSFSKSFALPVNTAERLYNSYLYNANTIRPVIIGIEGLDGSGKTVQANKLCEAITSGNKRASVIDFPQYESFFGKEIGTLLSAKTPVSAMNLDVKSMCLWYGLDRWKTINSISFDNVDYIIFNRYTLSSVAYQSARMHGGLNHEFADWVFELEHSQLGIPVPDIYIYLDTGPELCETNVLRKGRRAYVDGLDVYENSQLLLTCCRNIYKQLSNDIGEIFILDCLNSNGSIKSIDSINADIITILTKYGLYL